VFFSYLVEREVFEENPMARVKAPAETFPPIAYYELATAQRIVGGAHTRELRAAFALAYGGALELGAIITLRREQVHDTTQEIHAIGTKAHQRNRVVRVDSWAWPYIQEIVRDKLPTAYLFPEAWRTDRSIVSKLHRRTVAELQIEPQLTLHHARHAWAVSHLRAGMPTALVQQQLGHAGPMLTLTRYGAFIPQREDRDHWARVVQKAQARSAKGSAMTVNR